jgi:hypothetical protein
VSWTGVASQLSFRNVIDIYHWIVFFCRLDAATSVALSSPSCRQIGGNKMALGTLNMSGTANNEEAKLTIRLSPAAREAVNDIMKLGGYRTVQEAIRRAIGDELFLQRYRKDGWTVLLRKDKEYRELVWSDPI